MFAAAVAPSDAYDPSRVRLALAILGADPNEDLECAYCGAGAHTWDHIFATVKDSRFSGHGHRLGNLLPCCKPCNSQKGNRHWEVHLASLPMASAERGLRAQRIEQYIREFHCVDEKPEASEDAQRLEEIRVSILALMAEGDLVAERIRSRGPLDGK